MYADVENNKLEWKGHDRVACVVKVKVSCLYVTAYMTSNADARCPENVTKLSKISNKLLKQGCEFVTAADWNMVLEHRCCVIEIPGETGTCYSGRSIDYLVVSKNFRHCVRNVQVDKSASW